jgi:hypothetical protein
MEVFQFKENKTTLENNNTKTHKHKKEAKKPSFQRLKCAKQLQCKFF